MAETIIVKPELIRWAIERSGVPVRDLAQAFPKLDAWQRGERFPTIRQLQRLAAKTMTPMGYFFLDSPPDEKLPIPDFRTIGDTPVDRPSPNLLETIQAMQRRQTWMREFVIEDGHGAHGFVGSARSVRNVVTLAARIREALGLHPEWAEMLGTWEDALRALRNAAEQIGILVATAGVVGLNNHRPLDPQEFRGFVLCDNFAPLIFVNDADSKSAQMFTLAHELVHLWLGEGGIFNLIQMMPHGDSTERFCNQVAAEFLMPGHKVTVHTLGYQKRGTSVPLWRSKAGTPRTITQFNERVRAPLVCPPCYGGSFWPPWWFRFWSPLTRPEAMTGRIASQSGRLWRP